MTSWWHTALSAIMAGFAVLLPPIQTTISHHSAIAAVLGFAWAILGHLLPSPLVASK